MKPVLVPERKGVQIAIIGSERYRLIKLPCNSYRMQHLLGDNETEVGVYPSICRAMMAV